MDGGKESWRWRQLLWDGMIWEQNRLRWTPATKDHAGPTFSFAPGPRAQRVTSLWFRATMLWSSGSLQFYPRTYVS